MSDLATLLARCRELGAEFTPTSGGKLKVQAPADRITYIERAY